MSDQKKRHGCLTAYLIFMIVVNSLVALVYLLGSNFIKQNTPDIPSWAMAVLGIFCAFNVVCAIALFKWKKWGFWGFLFSSIVALFVNLSIGLGIGQTLFGLLGSCRELSAAPFPISRQSSCTSPFPTA